MAKYSFVLTSNTFGRTLQVKSQYDGVLGLVQHCGDWWYASPVVANSNRPLANVSGGPSRAFKSRSLAVAWLQGIKDTSMPWFLESVEGRGL